MRKLSTITLLGLFLVGCGSKTTADLLPFDPPAQSGALAGQQSGTAAKIETDDELRERANSADALAALELSKKLYAKADRTDADLVEIRRLLTIAADEGNAEAQFALGAMIQKGDGGAKDDALATQWFTKSAEGGNTRALFQMGLYAYHGAHGVEKDSRIALGYFLSAANKGDPMAAYNLAALYWRGEGTKIDGVSGYSWMLIAAALQEPKAMAKLETMGLKLSSDQRTAATTKANKFLAEAKKTLIITTNPEDTMLDINF